MVCDTLPCIVNKQQNVNPISLILSITDTHLVLFIIHECKLVNCLINLGYCNAALLMQFDSETWIKVVEFRILIRNYKSMKLAINI